MPPGSTRHRRSALSGPSAERTGRTWGFSRALVDAVGRVRADPLAQLGVADAGVDARPAGPRTALAPARRADDPEAAVGPATEHRPAGVALAGVDPAFREACADHGRGLEVVAVGVGAVLVGGDRHLRLLD